MTEFFWGGLTIFLNKIVLQILLGVDGTVSLQAPALRLIWHPIEKVWTALVCILQRIFKSNKLCMQVCFYKTLPCYRCNSLLTTIKSETNLEHIIEANRGNYLWYVITTSRQEPH